jgi:ribosomal protein S1
MTTALNKKIQSPLSQIIKNESDWIIFLKEGDLLEARLMKKTAARFYFDLGRFGTGVVYRYELNNAKNVIKDLQIGDLVNVKVLSIENEEGFVELSLLGARNQKNWQEIKDLKESGQILTVKIIGANSGGLMAEVFNIKAFLPASQLASEHYPQVLNADKSKIFEELKKMIGQELKVKIIDFNQNSNKVILSEKEAVGENFQELISRYKVGDVILGIVFGIADFGVFVRFADNPALEGLIHISELDHCLVDNPKDIVKMNDLIKAKIIDIKDRQVSLSMKALKENPWEKADQYFKAGDEVKGVVYKYSPFGAYINLPYNLQGIIHVSEFGGAEKMHKDLPIGQEKEFIIDAVRPLEKRIILKIKR